MGASTLATVVFLKVQDFSRRAASEQARLRAQLEAALAVTLAEIDPACRVVLEAADGAAVAVLGDPRGALRLAERSLAASAAGLPLSAGVNHGAVQVLEKGGMTGDGIAVAAAIAEHASSSRLLASRSFRDALADLEPGLEATLAPAGSFTDAGLRSHEVFAPDAGAPRRRGRRYAAASVLLVLALVGGGVGARVAKEGREPFVNAMTEKVQPYWRELVRKVRY